MVLRVAFFGTHPQQFNGYSKVVYELAKVIGANHANEVEWHIFGFQKFHVLENYRVDVPPNVHLYDAFAQEGRTPPGFGYTISKAYVERIQPDVVIIFNDLIILTTHLKELQKAANRDRFRLIAYIDQVYLTQHPHYLTTVNQMADEAILFTDFWSDCIRTQGIKLPCHSLPHGFDPNTYFPIPRRLCRRFYGINDDDFVVLNLNRNTIRKRWDICMMAFAHVVARRPDAKIKLLIGTDLTCAHNMKEIFEQELTVLGIPNPSQVAKERFIIPGKPQQLSDRETNILYNLADCGINTCEGEGFGLCNFEQAAIGVPQIVPWTGGFRDFFTEENAYIVKPKAWIHNPDPGKTSIGGKVELCDYNDFADAILALYDDPELRAKYARNAKATIPGSYKWAELGKRLVEICKQSAARLGDRPKPTEHKPKPMAAPGMGLDVATLNNLLTGGIVV